MAVIASREDPAELKRVLDALCGAAGKHDVVDLVVNGNPVLAEGMSACLGAWQDADAPLVRLWSIAVGDKAHAMNRYLHEIWPDAGVTYFVDGYVHVARDALALLDAALQAEGPLLGATGVPASGRSSARLRAQMLSEGGLHGNLFALKRTTVQALRDLPFHLPFGLYRTDSTLGAVLAFGLDPARHEWDIRGRVHVHPAVTWTTAPKRWWRLGDLKSQLRRRVRQAQGDFENRAVRHFLAERKRSPAALPDTVTALVARWAADAPAQLDDMLKQSRLRRSAWRALQAPRELPGEQGAPVLLGRSR